MKSVVNENEDEDDEVIFTTIDDRVFKFYHEQDCCESVRVEDVCGDLGDLVGVPLNLADEVSNYVHPEERDAESGTWTFYRFATIKGYVTIRWLGTSNGYYSESVDFAEFT
jgi:hypothetical protein